jgi:hypothetical protein
MRARYGAYSEYLSSGNLSLNRIDEEACWEHAGINRGRRTELEFLNNLWGLGTE